MSGHHKWKDIKHKHKRNEELAMTTVAPTTVTPIINFHDLLECNLKDGYVRWIGTSGEVWLARKTWTGWGIEQSLDGLLHSVGGVKTDREILKALYEGIEL
jgi:hypothetical protein